MDKLVLFLDLDGTLKTDMDTNGPFESQSITIKIGENSFSFVQRPHLHEFLDAVSKKAKLVLSTAAGGGYARKMLKAMNIDSYFATIIAAEDYRKQFVFKQGVRHIFIDNNAEMVQKKIDALSGGWASHGAQKEIWVVNTYLGDKLDKTLLELKEEIEKL